VLVPGFCEHGDESSGSTESEKFLGQLSDYKLLENDKATRSYYNK
jgi:hypothetical protein